MMNNNVATVNSISEAFGKGDIPAIIDCLADDVQWEQWENNFAQQEGVPWMQPRKGKEAVLGFLKRLQK